MAVQSTLQGVFAAIATPIQKDGRPDSRRFVALAANLLDNGCDGLNVLGTTGEGTSFSHHDRIELMTAIAGSGLSLDRIIIGVGSAAVNDVAELMSVAAELGFRGVLVLPPFYYKNVTSEGIVRFFAYLAAATKQRPVPIYLYNFPAMSGIAFDLDMISKLTKELGETIAGLKDSSGDVSYATEVAETFPDLAVFPSNEATIMQARDGPFAGCISATANLNADLCAKAFRAGDAEALATAVRIRSLFDSRTLVAGVKAVLAYVHDDEALIAVLPPLQEPTLIERTSLVRGYDSCRRVDGGMSRAAPSG
jgi:4-hydroxy-tetrahydrodipicolinate synthase